MYTRHESHTQQMRLRKLAISASFAVILVIQCVGLGWSITEEDSLNTAIYSLHITFALYALAISALAVNQTYSSHYQSIVHLSALTFIATGLLGTTAILPSQPFSVALVLNESNESGAPLILWYMVLALYALALVIAFTTPRGPRLHFPSEHIYSDKTLMQITSKYEDNVCGITGTFIHALARAEVYAYLVTRDRHENFLRRPSQKRTTWPTMSWMLLNHVILAPFPAQEVNVYYIYLSRLSRMYD